MPPRLLITLGDVAGVGPEIVVRSWPKLHEFCQPVVVGDRDWLRHAVELNGSRLRVQPIDDPREGRPDAATVPCVQGTRLPLRDVQPAQVSPIAGRAAYDFLCQAIDATLAGEADGIVTAPLHKEGLHAAGLPYPGHTEILAERCGVRQFAMLLFGDDLGIAHVTLHMALRDVFRHITTDAVLDKIHLLHAVLRRLLPRRPRIGVAALNPHASDGGLFGDEEMTLLRPAVEQGSAAGVSVSGPWPSDTLFTRAFRGEFDGIVAMYHDQGHIPMKSRCGWRLVNISAGLPIVRTSVAHGTAYDIAWRGTADPTSLIEAARIAALLVSARPAE
jgi:4-hydroxythreonine-4-phosphate dehydrogenase